MLPLFMYPTLSQMKIWREEACGVFSVQVHMHSSGSLLLYIPERWSDKGCGMEWVYYSCGYGVRERRDYFFKFGRVSLERSSRLGSFVSCLIHTVSVKRGLYDPSVRRFIAILIYVT